MKLLQRALTLFCLSAMVLTTVAPAWAQAPATASAFYVQYRKAFDAAKKVEDIYPFMAAARKKQMEDTPAKDRAEMFEMIKMMSVLTNVKVTKETAGANGGTTLTVTALDSDKKPTYGTITVLREAGAMKIDKESWSNTQP
jgi:hypothetical protein